MIQEVVENVMTLKVVTVFRVFEDDFTSTTDSPSLLCDSLKEIQ